MSQVFEITYGQTMTTVSADRLGLANALKIIRQSYRGLKTSKKEVS